jgi:hypothetical protein
VSRLRGGSRKGVYRLVLDNGTTAVLYVWDPSEDRWSHLATTGADGGAHPFSPASGLELFAAAHTRLEGLGVRAPRLHLLDGSRERFPAPVAVAEDVSGGSLESLLARDPATGTHVTARLAAVLERMHNERGLRTGKVAFENVGGSADVPSCEQLVLERALSDLTDAATRLRPVAEARHRLAEAVDELAAAIRPRADYRLVHGELGPDHVLVDEQGEPVLIDIEGLMFFDVEWEHTFLQLRFGEHYRWFRRDDLDEARMRFYRLAMHLSLVAGPLRLLDGDFPDRTAMLGIVRHNMERALDVVRT